LPSSASPREQDDLEARPTKEFEHDDHDLIDESDPFDIAQTKNAPIEILRQWRVTVVVIIIIISSLFLVIITST
jgi:Ca2+-transporting ATPase